MAHFEIVEFEGQKMIKAVIQNETIRAEAGALHYMRGQIEMESKAPSAGGMLKGIMTGETVFKPTYTGMGEVYFGPPIFGEYVILDPTWAPFSREIYCSAEQQQNYLIGTPEGEPLKRMPALEPESSLLKFEGVSNLRSDGSLEAEVLITGEGRSDTNMRRALAFVSMPSRRAYFDKLLEAVAPGAELLDFEYSTLDDFDRSQTYSMRFRIRPGLRPLLLPLRPFPK